MTRTASQQNDIDNTRGIGNWLSANGTKSRKLQKQYGSQLLAVAGDLEREWPVTAPAPNGLVYAMDVSSNNSYDDVDAFLGLHPEIELVIDRLYIPGERPSREVSKTMANIARSHNRKVGGYIWAYPDFVPQKTANDALTVANYVGVDSPIIWIDAEPYNNGPMPSQDWFDRFLTVAGNWGIYTGAWCWNKNDPYLDCTLLPLWAAAYPSDGQPDLDAVPMFGGWTSASGQQYLDHPDLDAFRRELVLP